MQVKRQIMEIEVTIEKLQRAIADKENPMKKTRNVLEEDQTQREISDKENPIKTRLVLEESQREIFNMKTRAFEDQREDFHYHKNRENPTKIRLLEDGAEIADKENPMNTVLHEKEDQKNVSDKENPMKLAQTRLEGFSLLNSFILFIPSNDC